MREELRRKCDPTKLVAQGDPADERQKFAAVSVVEEEYAPYFEGRLFMWNYEKVFVALGKPSLCVLDKMNKKCTSIREILDKKENKEYTFCKVKRFKFE